MELDSLNEKDEGSSGSTLLIVPDVNISSRLSQPCYHSVPVSCWRRFGEAQPNVTLR
jgi:hypothetical protein